MSPHHAPDEEPLLPPAERDAEQGLWRWALATVLVAVILVGAYQAYRWLASDVERRRAVAAGTAVPEVGMVHEEVRPDALQGGGPTTADVPANGAANDAANGAAIGAGARPPPAGQFADEPVPPAVTGNAIHKCVSDGHVTYSNQPCPKGSQQDNPQASGADENGVTGSAGDGVPSQAAVRPISLGQNDPDRRAAVCGYLEAEISRLDYEFQQPLPPPVLDDISTQLSGLRAQARSIDCALPPQAVAAGKPQPATRRRAVARHDGEVPGE